MLVLLLSLLRMIFLSFFLEKKGQNEQKINPLICLIVADEVSIFFFKKNNRELNTIVPTRAGLGSRSNASALRSMLLITVNVSDEDKVGQSLFYRRTFEKTRVRQTNK